MKTYRFDGNSHCAPAYTCSIPGDNSGDYLRLEEVEEVMAAEILRLEEKGLHAAMNLGIGAQVAIHADERAARFHFALVTGTAVSGHHLEERLAKAKARVRAKQEANRVRGG